MRRGVSDPGASTYFNQEVFLNNLKLISINSATERALAVALVDADGNQITPVGSANTVGDGRKTVTTAGTAEQFTAQACKYVIIVGLPGNTNGVVIGGSTVVAATGTRRGVVLYAEQSQRFDITNMNLLYIDSITNGEGVAFTYFN